MPISRQSLISQLADGVTALGFTLPQHTIEQCLEYTELLLHWNRTHNLTAASRPEEIISRHLLDSLSISSLICWTRILDIGSGGGFPGIPLALALPNTFWTLVDSRGKRTRFLQEVVNRLGLERVKVVQHRVEHYRPLENFDTLVARAVAPLPRLVAITQHLWQEGARVIVMKGSHIEPELKQVPQEFQARVKVVRLSIPGLELHRQAVVFQN